MPVDLKCEVDGLLLLLQALPHQGKQGELVAVLLVRVAVGVEPDFSELLRGEQVLGILLRQLLQERLQVLDDLLVHLGDCYFILVAFLLPSLE